METAIGPRLIIGFHSVRRPVARTYTNLNAPHWSDLTNRKDKIVEFVWIVSFLYYFIYMLRKNFGYIRLRVNLKIALGMDQMRYRSITEILLGEFKYFL